MKDKANMLYRLLKTIDMGKKETKKYSDIPVQQTNASEPLGIYGDIIAQKDKFEQEWEQGLTVEDFRIQCKRKLKEMYARN